MAIFSFSSLKDVFGANKELTAEQQQELFEELLFLTLSRASRSDLDISEVEISKIRESLKEFAGIEATDQEIRMAGMSELYDVASFESYASNAATELSKQQRYKIVLALFRVISADSKVNEAEADFFDELTEILKLRPIELLGANIE